MSTMADLRKFQEFFEYVIEKQGFRFFYHHTNMGLPTVVQTVDEIKHAARWKASSRTKSTYTLLKKLADLGARPDNCCFEFGLIKPGLVHDVIERNEGESLYFE